jgi:hypothetical protein
MTTISWEVFTMIFLIGLSLLLVSYTPLVLAEQLRVGPVYTKQPGEVSVVIELPPAVIPAAADFHLIAAGNPMATAQEIKYFRDSLEDLALAVCVDVSGTMAGRPLDEAKKALFDFLGKARARPRDKIALISFADDVKVESSFEGTRDQLDDAVRYKLDDAVRNLKIRGYKTRLVQAISEVLGRFEDAHLPKRQRIIVISDGKDEGSQEYLGSVTKKSIALGIPIDTVGLGKIELQYVEALRYLSDQTGGQFVHARPNILAPTDALDRIYNGLLETRSLMVYFKYKADKAGRTIQNASIELRQLGHPPLRGEIRTAIPQAMPPDPDFRWLWFLGVVLLGVGLVVFVRHRMKSKDQLAKETEPPELDKSEIQFQPGLLRGMLPPVVPPERPRQTQIGSYYFPVPEPGHPAAILLGITGPVAGQQFSIEKEIFHIGAGPDNDLPLAHDEYVSGDHAYLRYERGSVFIFDKGSRNGTFVNQQAVTDTGFALSLGDHIQLGMSTFEVARAPS